MGLSRESKSWQTRLRKADGGVWKLICLRACASMCAAFDVQIGAGLERRQLCWLGTLGKVCICHTLGPSRISDGMAVRSSHT